MLSVTEHVSKWVDQNSELPKLTTAYFKANLLAPLQWKIFSVKVYSDYYVYTGI